jgi:hypothetical protein
MLKEDKRICDTCDNFIISPDGCNEGCWLNKKKILPDDYCKDRFNGNKQNCKGYKLINSYTKNI